MVRVLFIHPDLGIGGAERLVVDAALALQKTGHLVQFLTNHHDPSHCFEETRDGTLKVQTVGDWLPRSIFNIFIAACAYFRMLYATLYTTFVLSRQQEFDVIFVDSISIGVPLLKFAAGSPKILFYCHFPDLLMAPQGGCSLRKLYRYPINWAEESTTRSADAILVNSKFTRRMFKETFKRITTMPSVLYPSLNTKYFDNAIVTNSDPEDLKLRGDAVVFLSINRFERKKNIPLALKAFKELEKHVSKLNFDRCHLILAGGYDKRVIENVEHFEELEALAEELGVKNKCTLLKSPSDKFKLWLLNRCDALIYTPSNEHFGIVPIEAMYMKKPVIACNSGGPTETVVHESTGFLCEPTKEFFSQSMAKFVIGGGDRNLSENMGEKGRKRVQQHFSFEAFTDKLNEIIQELMIGQATPGNCKKSD